MLQVIKATNTASLNSFLTNFAGIKKLHIIKFCYGYLPVAYWHNTRNKWHARIKINGKHVSLGLYDIEEDAAIAYDCAAIGYFGDYALLNILFKD